MSNRHQGATVRTCMTLNDALCFSKAVIHHWKKPRENTTLDIFFVFCFFVTILDVLAATFWEVELAVRGVILWANHPLFHPEPQNKPPRSHSGSLLRTWRKLLHASAFLPITLDVRFMVGWASAWLLNFSRTRRVKNLSRAESRRSN